MSPVRALKLDSLGLERLDFLKVDVEGMEIDVLRGAARSLETFKPILLVEHHKSDVALMGQLRQDLGYQIYSLGAMNLSPCTPKTARATISSKIQPSRMTWPSDLSRRRGRFSFDGVTQSRAASDFRWRGRCAGKP
jgi:hypothetical protein